MGGRTNEIQVSRELYPAGFKWPKHSPRCGATMISPQMALTAAHCVSQGEDMAQNLNMQIELTDGDGNFNTYDITDIRANECWWTEIQETAARSAYESLVENYPEDLDM